MNRNYSDLEYLNEERREYYERADRSEQKAQGNKGEEIARRMLEKMGYTVTPSSADEDATDHVDLHAHKTLDIDVKYKKDFWLELTNHWGRPGWVFTGADYIIQLFTPDSAWKKSYFIDRKKLVQYINTHRGLFIDQYCTFYDRSKLWKVYPKRIPEMIAQGCIKELPTI